MNAVLERRKAIEAADRERKEAMLKKAQERDEKMGEKRRQRENSANVFAFGSSTPRTLHPSLGASTTDLWAGSRSRSTSSSNMMTQSMYAASTSNRKSIDKGLDRNDGE